MKINFTLGIILSISIYRCLVICQIERFWLNVTYVPVAIVLLSCISAIPYMSNLRMVKGVCEGQMQDTVLTLTLLLSEDILFVLVSTSLYPWNNQRNKNPYKPRTLFEGGEVLGMSYLKYTSLLKAIMAGNCNTAIVRVLQIIPENIGKITQTEYEMMKYIVHGITKALCYRFSVSHWRSSTVRWIMVRLEEYCSHKWMVNGTGRLFQCCFSCHFSSW